MHDGSVSGSTTDSSCICTMDRSAAHDRFFVHMHDGSVSSPRQILRAYARWIRQQLHDKFSVHMHDGSVSFEQTAMPNLPETPPDLLRPLAEHFPNEDAAMAEIARLSAVLTLPKGTIHVISDIHGEDQKLRHVINNASGTLRPLVEKMFASSMPPKQFQEFLTLIFYPAEVTQRLEEQPRTTEETRAFALSTLRRLFDLARVLATRYSLRRALTVFPAEYRELFSEVLHEPVSE